MGGLVDSCNARIDNTMIIGSNGDIFKCIYCANKQCEKVCSYEQKYNRRIKEILSKGKSKQYIIGGRFMLNGGEPLLCAETIREIYKIASGVFHDIQIATSFCISPDGMIYKCISGMSMDEYLVCHITEYGTRKYFNRLAHLVETPKHCIGARQGSCEFSLICDGGCLFKERHNGWSCQKTLITDADLKLLYEQVCREEKGNSDL